MRDIGGGGVYIELSQETSCWAQIQIPDNVWGRQTMFGWNSLWLVEAFLGRARHCLAGPDNDWLGVPICGWLERDLESLDLIIFTSSTRPSL
jgi:hypothetical protein